MSKYDDLERRVTSLETGLADVRTLAAGADRDVANFRAEIRGQTRMIEALRETQVDHYNEHKADHAKIQIRLTQIIRMLESLGADSGNENN